MNREAFKLARATLRTAVKAYGWERRGTSSLAHPLGSGRIYHKYYRAALGRFEGEHWSIVHWYEEFMNGGSDSFGSSYEAFEPSAKEAEAFGIEPGNYVVLEFSDSGFVSQTEMTPTEYAALCADESAEDEQP